MVQPDYWRLPAPGPASRGLDPGPIAGAVTRLAPPAEEDIGGVSAVLDYDMQEMSIFLASQVQAILSVGSMQRDFGSPPALIKFALQLLHATRLPLSTILAGLVYLENRPGYLQMLTNSSYYAMTTMLVISNKFMDDHTFTNRSWSEVTGFDLSLINQLERDWLVGIRFSLTIESNGGYVRYQRAVSLWQAFMRRHVYTACACQECIAAWFPIAVPCQPQPLPQLPPVMPAMAFALRA